MAWPLLALAANTSFDGLNRNQVRCFTFKLSIFIKIHQNSLQNHQKIKLKKKLRTMRDNGTLVAPTAVPIDVRRNGHEHDRPLKQRPTSPPTRSNNSTSSVEPVPPAAPAVRFNYSTLVNFLKILNFVIFFLFFCFVFYRATIHRHLHPTPNLTTTLIKNLLNILLAMMNYSIGNLYLFIYLFITKTKTIQFFLNIHFLTSTFSHIITKVKKTIFC